MGFFGAAKGWGGAFWPPPPKICHTYPAMMKLGIVIPYLRKIKKYINRVAHPLSSADIVGNKQILLHQEIQIQMVTPGFLKIRLF